MDSLPRGDIIDLIIRVVIIAALVCCALKARIAVSIILGVTIAVSICIWLLEPPTFTFVFSWIIQGVSIAGSIYVCTLLWTLWRTGVAPQLPSGGVHVWEVDNIRRIERFFEELAQENPVRFTPQQLCDFTDNYSTVLGSGGFGKVYKGQFPNGVKIAVKVINRSVEDQFMAEVGTIGRTHHINLVRLYGFCYDRNKNALVYEFMENGSLDRHLFTENRELEWEKLYEIAVGTAKGIAYLHEEVPQMIIHYDIKPGNVLLDGNFNPKIADFGMARLCNRDATHISITGCRGTPGYLAPEFFLNNFPISYKCDVYSFGILLFEIFGRRKNTGDGGNNSNESLDWFPKKVWEEFEKGELVVLTEACGITEKDKVKAERMAMVALWCAQDSPEARPPMSAVVKMLEGGVEIMPPPKPFRHLYSVVSDALEVPGYTGSETDYTSSEGDNSYWYKETTPTMAKYEITVATL